MSADVGLLMTEADVHLSTVPACGDQMCFIWNTLILVFRFVHRILILGALFQGAFSD